LKMAKLYFLISVVLFTVILTQAQDPNKCYTEWDFCNSGTEAENAYFWKLGWYASAAERGEVSTSASTFMGQDEGTVTIPKTANPTPIPPQHENSPHTEPPTQFSDIYEQEGQDGSAFLAVDENGQAQWPPIHVSFKPGCIALSPYPELKCLIWR